MAHTGSVILIEFNELCPPLMEQFIEHGLLPNFARFRSESQVYLTQAAEQPPHLEPWIQWITVHTGLRYEQHRVFNLGEGHKVRQPAIWDVLGAAGMRSWVCGSMNVRWNSPFSGAVLPDPWTTQLPPEPSELEPYFRFVSCHVREYTNDRVPLSRRDYLDFARFMARRGLRFETVRAILEQLILERRRRSGHWRRATILDRIQFDVFRWYWRSVQPHFATFFSNSTAHFQHMYWRNMEPAKFKVQPDAAEQAELAEAIQVGYQSMDRLLGEIVALAGGRTTLVFCTALSQQPCLLYEDSGGKVFYRPHNFEALLQWAGIEHSFSVAPVMSHYFHVYFEGEGQAHVAAQKLRALTVDGISAMNVAIDGRKLFCGCRMYRAVRPAAMLRAGENGGRTAPFEELFYRSEGIKSGMHHRDGILWIRTPDLRHSVHAEKVPLERIAPMILDMFSLERPSSMQADPLDGYARLCAAS